MRSARCKGGSLLPIDDVDERGNLEMFSTRINRIFFFGRFIDFLALKLQSRNRLSIRFKEYRVRVYVQGLVVGLGCDGRLGGYWKVMGLVVGLGFGI